MEPEALAGMLFTLILVAMIGGIVLLLPISRRLGALLERRIENQSVGGISPDDLRRIEVALTSVRSDLRQLAERQEFTESLLARGQPPGLPTESSAPEG